MRSAWGLFVAMLAILLGGGVGRVHAQASPAGPGRVGGQVLQIGFEGHFQPTAWAPMKVSVTPPAEGGTGLYQVRVHQKDLDGDEVIYKRSVTLTAGVPNQEFWVYFKPQPVDVMSAGDPPSVRQRLRVVLCDEQGRELAQLAVPGNVTPLYSGADMRGGTHGRGKRIVLMVADPGGFLPGTAEDATDVNGVEITYGQTEEIRPIAVTPASLPDRSIGYAGVDAVIWQDADPEVLLDGTGERMAAIRQWVQGGGKLIVMGRSEWQSLEPLADLLPVTLTGSVEKTDLAPLLAIVRENRRDSELSIESWNRATGPFRYILSVAKPDALVESVFTYEEPRESGPMTAPATGEAPMIARRGEGFGSVTWLALDLSVHRNILAPPQQYMGWNIVRAHLLGLGDRPVINPSRDVVRRTYPDMTGATLKDLGNALLEGSRLPGRSVALVTVAMVFFIVYWLIAGPGLYFYLASKGRTPLSWFVFGAVAVGATLVTLGVVRLILRGPPDLRHLSVVRQGPVAPQRVHSEMGLYIPEDGAQRLMIAGGAPAAPPPTLTGFAIDPDHQTGAGGTRSNPITYVVSLDPPDESQRRGAEGTATVVDIPYRSTLKKLEADWAGPVVRGIDGNPRLVPASQGWVTGTLVNATGRELVNVHFAFYHDESAAQQDVYILFVPRWRHGEAISGLNSIIRPEGGQRVKFVDTTTTGTAGPPTQRDAVFGRLSTEWSRYWFNYFRTSLLTTGPTQYNDWFDGVRRAPAMLSFFSLLPPMLNDNTGVTGLPDASILLRQGARELDISPAVLAGRLVIIAEAESSPLPVPLTVDGDPITGTGRTIYQLVLPLDRTPLEQAKAQRRAEEQSAATQPEPVPEEQAGQQQQG